MESVSSHSSNSIKSPTLSLSEACLKYEEKEKQRIESIQAICNDSSYQRIMNLTDAPHAIDNYNPTPTETDYIEPESPTKIKLYSPVLSSKTYPTTYTYSSFKIDSMEFDLNISARTDSSSVESTTTNTSSSSAAAPSALASHISHTESMTSSISSANQSLAHSAPEMNSATNLRLQELEQRCASLEDQITTLTLWVIHLRSRETIWVIFHLHFQRKCSSQIVALQFGGQSADVAIFLD